MRIAIAVLLIVTATAAPAAVGAVGTVPAVQYYLQLDGVPGEANARGYENQIETLSFAWGEANATSASSSTGAGAGKVTFQPFSITKKIDKASPTLMLACASGKHFPKATLHVVRTTAASRAEFVTFTLEGLVITSYQVGGDAGGDLPTESLSLSFGRITFAERSQSFDGALGPVVTGTWDLDLNKKL